LKTLEIEKKKMTKELERNMDLQMKANCVEREKIIKTNV
jgi:hypothetical protein